MKTEKRYVPVEQSIRESFREIKLMRENKLPKKSWDNFLKKIEAE